MRPLKTERGAPLATIIIPTHDRAATLPFSIQSALDQTVREIEVVVVGDGCTDECRRVAFDYAARDHRVIFRDLAKAPLRGVANRDLAVREANGEFIFYNDDDDLLLPHHIAVLGRALSHADIADTPVISVSPSGQIDLGLHESSQSMQRRLLVSRDLKMVFDTHLGHRKSAYVALGSPWVSARDWNATMHMFGVFAADARTRWLSVQRITALSFHGQRRIAMTPEERRQELAHWSRQANRPLFEQQLRGRGSYSFHTLRLVSAFAKAGAGHEESRAFLYRLLRKASWPFGPTRSQRRAVDAVLTLVFGGRPREPGSREVLTDLLDARLGPDFGPVRLVVDLFKARIGEEKLLDHLSEQTMTPSAVFAQLYLRSPVAMSDPTLMGAANDVFAAAPSVTKFHFAEAVAGLLFEARELSASWDWTERAAPLAPQSFRSASFWNSRMRLARELGFNEQAEEASSLLALQRARMD